MSKLFAFAGTCVENGAVVYKFANDANRAKSLERFGCTEVKMIELPFTMAKEAAIDYLNAQGMTATKPARGAKPKLAAVKVKVKAKAVKDVKVVATKAKRVPNELKPGMDAAKFFDAWMADRGTKADAWREKNGM